MEDPVSQSEKYRCRSSFLFLIYSTIFFKLDPFFITQPAQICLDFYRTLCTPLHSLHSRKRCPHTSLHVLFAPCPLHPPGPVRLTLQQLWLWSQRAPLSLIRGSDVQASPYRFSRSTQLGCVLLLLASQHLQP